MKTNIVDPNALRAVSPAALAAYVRMAGWVRAERFGEHSDVYTRTGSPEVIVPGTEALADYPAVVANILTALSGLENRDELQVYRDLVGAERDVIRVRAPDAEHDGSIAVDDGVEVVSHARDMLLSAACSAHQPRRAYRAGRVREANTYMERVRLGQTEHGSFVVTLLAPVPPALAAPAQAALWPEESDDPYERQVTRRLASGLMAARGAAELAIRGEGMGAFEDAVVQGVSANLCESLAALIERGEGLDVSIAWAKTRPTPEVRRRIEFSRADGEVFSEAARIFRTREAHPDERLETFVVKLNRRPEDPMGRVTMRAALEGRHVSVTTELPEALYALATAAHDDRQTLMITGDLRRQGQRWRLDNPRELAIIKAPDEDDAA